MQQPINRGDPNGTDFFEYCWDEISNRSLLSPMDLKFAAQSYKGNISGVWDPNGIWARAVAAEEDWINSDYNNELINASSDPNKPGSPKYQPDTNGFYGIKSKNSRVAPGSAADASQFFEAITYGHYVFSRPTPYGGVNRYMAPYGNIVYRPDSKSGTPVVEFNNYPTIPNQKIHFEESK